MKEKDKWIKNFRTRMEGCSSCCLVSGCVFIDRMVLAVTFCKLFGETVGRVECNARTR